MYIPGMGTGTAVALITSALSFTTFLTFVPSYLEMFAAFDRQMDYNQAVSNNFNNATEKFEFIIIGGGSAGAVVANRLSKYFKVLVLEAGGDPNPFMSIPYVQGSLIGSSYDYQYKTIPQERACKAMVDNRMNLPFGKCLGGTSNINNMMYMRGCPKDYDNWAKITGDNEWSYENVLPYFKKSEDYHGNFDIGNREIHDDKGELYVGKLGYELPSTRTFFQAITEKGLSELDLNSNSSLSLEGFMHADIHIKNGYRWGSYQAFLKPILKRENLNIYRYSKVIRVHLNNENQAIGVTYIRHGQKYYVEATKEIILSAGPIDSPKLLLLSGIGPQEHLQSIGIDPVINLPAVGKNIQDHVATTIGPILLSNNNNSNSTFLSDRDLNNAVINEYILNGTGPLSSTQFRIALGYITSEEFKDPSWPDIYLIVSGRGIDNGFGPGLAKGLGGKPNVFESYLQPYIGQDAHQIRVILARPKSTGEIRLASSNPDDMPLINPNYYASEMDVKRMIEGINFILNLYETSAAFKSLNATFATNKFPGCEDYEFRSSTYWECYIKHFTMTMSHHCGGCSMGNPNNTKTAVVDSKLRVLKTKGLRVIDASVMPEVIIGNTNAPTVLIGEKGSDFILKDWNVIESS